MTRGCFVSECLTSDPSLVSITNAHSHEIWVLADSRCAGRRGCRSSPPPGSSWEADNASLFNERVFPSTAAGWSVYQIAACGRLASVSLQLKTSECQIRKKSHPFLENSQHEYVK